MKGEKHGHEIERLAGKLSVFGVASSVSDNATEGFFELVAMLLEHSVSSGQLNVDFLDEGLEEFEMFRQNGLEEGQVIRQKVSHSNHLFRRVDANDRGCIRKSLSESARGGSHTATQVNHTSLALFAVSNRPEEFGSNLNKSNKGTMDELVWVVFHLKAQ